jgi:hypothetical protein
MAMTKNKDTQEPSTRSPFAGCAILIIAVVMLVFLVGFSIIALFRQAGEIAKFTTHKPVKIEITSKVGKEAAIADLSHRLEEFKKQLQGNSETSLSLTADDLNLAIASYDSFKDLRGSFRVEQIDGKEMHIAISYPINGKPRLARGNEVGWVASDMRYLNATLISHPALLKKEVVLQIDKIEVPGATVPPGFIDQMSPYRITERYLQDREIGPAMAKLTHLELLDGKLVLTRNPKETPADMITNDQVDSASHRLFVFMGIAATLFLVFAAIVLMIGFRAKARKEKGR